ncbi:Putative flavin carrier protein 3 [Hypoxylon texense]
MKILLSTTALYSVASAIHAVSVVSNTPYDCDAVRGVDIYFAPDENTIHANFPTVALTVIPPAHGFPNGDSSAVCDATVDFEDFLPSRRLAIANVTWSTGNLNLSKTEVLSSLRSKVKLNIEHQTNYYPIKYPIVKDLSSATLVDLDVNPGLAGKSYEGYHGDFNFTADNPSLVWSSCFNGFLDNSTKFDFEMVIETVGGGTSERMQSPQAIRFLL